ncbi:TetR/AcrR family transcriptional regulator [Actinokineospora pegani]|uniref:TetR/AcrR family transcriptional regulator n=1 Tax=Actinokineospora pegani TaxID=2654637 RepID=UPI001F471F36|nr:TetR/AcrR family transcriptional regulator [Actinokineospora pegani]
MGDTEDGGTAGGVEQGAKRLMELLWRDKGAPPPQKRGTAGRKPTLTLDAVVRAAIELADAEGLAALSMARVAKALGAGTMTLYSYVPGKAELLDLMVDQVFGERDLLVDVPGGGWRDKVRHYAERTLRMHRGHPWLRQVSTLRPPLGPGSLEGEEYLLAALVDTGLTARQTAAAARSVASFVDAAAAEEVERSQVEAATGQSDDAWWQARQWFWETYFDYERFPAMVRVWEAGGFDQATAEQAAEAYEFGLARLLDGIEGLIGRG